MAKLAAAAGVLAFFIASAAYADSASDGNAALEALNKGSYDEAIRLFSRAIASGELAPADEEFAYYNRAQAYFDKQEYGRAIADLKAAVRLKPDDADAENGLQLALSKEVDLSDVSPKAAAANRPGFWGSLGQAIIAGAAAGIQQGLQNAAQGQSDGSPSQ